jgi:cobalt/nickel transport system permease protein
MHLPDGTINNQASLTFIVLSGGFVLGAIRQVKSQLFEKIKANVPQLATEFGSLSSPKIKNYLNIKPEAKKALRRSFYVFSAVYLVQLFDFPIINGVSGHLIGASLAGIVLGPALGGLTMSAVLLVQALSGDGGIMALGANIFTMAIVGSAAGYYCFIWLKNFLSISAAIFLATALSVIASAAAFGLILFVSHQIGFTQLLSEIIIPHLEVGLLEGLFSLVIIRSIFSTNLPSYQPTR